MRLSQALGSNKSTTIRPCKITQHRDTSTLHNRYCKHGISEWSDSDKIWEKAASFYQEGDYPVYSENEKHHLFAEIIIRHIPVNKFHLGFYALINKWYSLEISLLAVYHADLIWI